MALILPSKSKKNSARQRMRRRKAAASSSSSSLSATSKRRCSFRLLAMIVFATLFVVWMTILMATVLLPSSSGRSPTTKNNQPPIPTWMLADFSMSGEQLAELRLRQRQRHAINTTISSPLLQQQQQEEHAHQAIPTLHQEDIFRSTLHSCIPSNDKKCKLYIPPPPTTTGNANKDNNNNTNNNNNLPRQRVAVIAPPGTVAHAVGQVVQVLAQVHNERVLQVLQRRRREGSIQQQQQQQYPDGGNDDSLFLLDILLTTHVPPYGYGKTHGLTKIIRLASPLSTLSSSSSDTHDDGDERSSTPLMLDVTQALLWQQHLIPSQLSSLSSQISNNVTITDISQALPQLVRFHCRLSHVAAHTSLLTLNVAQLLVKQQPQPQQQEGIQNDNNNAALVDLWDFLTAPSQQDGSSNATCVLRSDKVLPLLEPKLSQLEQAWRSAEQQGWELLRHVGGGGSGSADTKETDKDQNQALWNQVLSDELTASKNLTVWPCPSFWKSSSSSNNRNNNNNSHSSLTPLTQSLALSLSPNCSDPLASCWVERDRCEARGDALCRATKTKK